MSGLDKTATILAAIGAINWGLTALNWNLVEVLIGRWSTTLAMIIYYIIGLSGIWVLIKVFK